VRRRRHPPGVVACQKTLRVAAVQDECRRSLRVRRREQSAHRCPFGHPQKRRPARADGVAHRQDVGHPRLERRELRLGDAIAEPGAALVEQDQPGECGQPGEEPSERRLIPRRLEMRHPSRDPDEIPGTFPQDLVRDRNAVGSYRISRLANHRESVSQTRQRQPTGPSSNPRVHQPRTLGSGS